MNEAKKVCFAGHEMTQNLYICFLIVEHIKAHVFCSDAVVILLPDCAAAHCIPSNLNSGHSISGLLHQTLDIYNCL